MAKKKAKTKKAPAKKVQKSKKKAPTSKKTATSKKATAPKTKAPQRASKKHAVATEKTSKRTTAPAISNENSATAKTSVLKSVTPQILSAPAKSKASEPVRVQAEIVENAIANRTPTDLAPLADGLSAYLANVNKYPLLTREQEEMIAKRYFADKNPSDAQLLVTSNLRFVVKVAADYAKFGNKLLDLIQEGNVGLMHAVKEFNPYKGVRLITYAVWWIRGYIQEYLMRQHSVVRIGTTQNQRKLFYHLQKEKNMLDQLGQEPSVKLLAARLGVPEHDVRMMEERMSGGDMSLDAPVGGDNDTSRVHLETNDDEIPVDEELARRESLHMLEDKIQELRPQLSDKELIILEERILADAPVTLQDIGEKWGVTREAVRQMESRLIKKIKDEVLKSQS